MEGESGQPVGGEPTTAEETALQAGSATQPSPQKPNWENYVPRSTVLTLQDFVDLPRQILPEATYTHLKNAGREVWLAVSSLVESASKTLDEAGKNASNAGNRPRKRIDVE